MCMVDVYSAPALGVAVGGATRLMDADKDGRISFAELFMHANIIVAEAVPLPDAAVQAAAEAEAQDAEMTQRLAEQERMLIQTRPQATNSTSSMAALAATSMRRMTASTAVLRSAGCVEAASIATRSLFLRAPFFSQATRAPSPCPTRGALLLAAPLSRTRTFIGYPQPPPANAGWCELADRTNE